MSLKSYGGKVPIKTNDEEHPIKLIDFPSREVFESIYHKRVKGENIGRYYNMMFARSKGATMPEIAKIHAISRERVRQIEIKFLRMMRQYHAKQRA